MFSSQNFVFLTVPGTLKIVSRLCCVCSPLFGLLCDLLCVFVLALLFVLVSSCVFIVNFVFVLLSYIWSPVLGLLSLQSPGFDLLDLVPQDKSVYVWSPAVISYIANTYSDHTWHAKNRRGEAALACWLADPGFGSL